MSADTSRVTLMSRLLPWDGNSNSHSGPKSCEGWALGGERGRRADSHVGNKTQRGLLTFLETSQHQQQVAFLIDQRLSEALGTQVALVQTLHLQTSKKFSTRPQARFTFKEMPNAVTHVWQSLQLTLLLVVRSLMGLFSQSVETLASSHSVRRSCRSRPVSVCLREAFSWLSDVTWAVSSEFSFSNDSSASGDGSLCRKVEGLKALCFYLSTVREYINSDRSWKQSLKVQYVHFEILRFL